MGLNNMSEPLRGRWFGPKDINFVNSISEELLNDVVQTEIIFLKACADATKLNIYGESSPSEGKQFYPGIQIACLIDRGDISTDADDFGPNRLQNVVFKFREAILRDLDLFPQTGDLILFNARYHEVDDIVQEQFLGGIPEKSFSIICNTHYSRLSSKDIVIRQS